MAMNNKGLGKLIEECGELTQAAGKKLAIMDSDDHWDGSNLKTRLEDEIADVMAASHLVMDKFDLDADRILERRQHKLSLFRYWDGGGKRTTLPTIVTSGYVKAYCHEDRPMAEWCDFDKSKGEVLRGGFMGHTCLPKGSVWDTALDAWVVESTSTPTPEKKI